MKVFILEVILFLFMGWLVIFGGYGIFKVKKIIKIWIFGFFGWGKIYRKMK